ncbi:hypothetical protein WG66_015482 [Moniliophthora roreri]|uniref:Peptidase S26 domain-containing protein n=1 Tax=Moniliophthora roreri TaxID=221103 RepID=A0A0W0FY43_MONRR|nr:hypothetical protein WG66_015482 [Moniliophthora roreri]
MQNRPFGWLLGKLARLREPGGIKFAVRYAGVSGFKLLNTFCAIHIFLNYVGRPSPMYGPSMLPTFANEGEIVIEDRLTYRLWPESLARGDLVVLTSPIDPTMKICKRVLGLPGDIVCVDPTGEKAPSTEHVLVPRGHIWISGDNAVYSRDSRDYGPVPMALIQGRVYARVWPLSAWKVFRNETRVVT